MLKLNLKPYFIVAAGILLTACEAKNAQTVIKPNYDLLSSCERTGEEDSNIVDEAMCGTISVFENRDLADGRKIDLNVMILPATSAVTLADPVFFLAGGPGQAAVDVGPRLFRRLSDMRQERDIVLVDQRGTGKSNSLACEVDITDQEAMTLSAKAFEERQIERIKVCLSEYDADPRFYTTPIAMDDLNEVREVLGYGNINLYGISYGTRAALVYLRRHEETVRSMILDSVAPLSMSIPTNVAIDAQTAFDLVINDCKNQPGCAEAYPNLQQHLRELVKRLTDKPEVVSVLHPRTGEVQTAPLDPILIGRLIRGVMYDRTLSRLLPLAIEEAFDGNYQPISTLGYAFTGDDSQSGMSIGMMSAVLCSADMQHATAANDSADFDNAIYGMLKPICDIWPKGEMPDGYFNPVKSNVPTLLTSGELDPITPPKYGNEAALTLENSRHLVVAGVGHSVTINGCLPKLMDEFLDNPDPANLDVSCSDKLKRLPFFTSFAGPLVPKQDKEEVQND